MAIRAISRHFQAELSRFEMVNTISGFNRRLVPRPLPTKTRRKRGANAQFAATLGPSTDGTTRQSQAFVASHLIVRRSNFLLSFLYSSPVLTDKQTKGQEKKYTVRRHLPSRQVNKFLRDYSPKRHLPIV